MALRPIFLPAASPPRLSQARQSFAASPTASLAARESRRRRPQNVEGEFFVDHTCIDCDVCRWIAPKTFSRIAEQSAVYNQPASDEERLKALQALLCCPTSSIRTEKPPREIREVHELFPLPVDASSIPGVYHCGYHSERSYAATSYFIVHPEGNILVDSPRYVEVLARKIEQLGGARYMFLTHKDDVGDHEKWQKRLGSQRILHSADVEPDTADVEMKLHGCGPWNIGHDFELIHTPGHTKGSVCLYYKPLKVLFTGDHLMASENLELTYSEIYNFYSVPVQLDNIERFLDLDFLWILPGHGRRIQFEDIQAKNCKLKTLLAGKRNEHPFSRSMWV